MELQEYEKRLATAIKLLGEAAGRRYMEQRLRELRPEIEQRLTQKIKERLAGLSLPHPLVLYLDIGPHGVKIRFGRPLNFNRKQVKKKNETENNKTV